LTVKTAVAVPGQGAVKQVCVTFTVAESWVVNKLAGTSAMSCVVDEPEITVRGVITEVVALVHVTELKAAALKVPLIYNQKSVMAVPAVMAAPFVGVGGTLPA